MSMRAEQAIETAFSKYDEAIRTNDLLGAVRAVLELRELATVNALACWRAFMAGACWARAQLELSPLPDAAMQEAADARYPFEDSVRVRDLEHQLEQAKRGRSENLVAFARSVSERTNAQVERNTLRTIVEEAIGGLTTIDVVDEEWQIVNPDGTTELLLGALPRLMRGGTDVGGTDQSGDAGGAGDRGQGGRGNGDHVSSGDEAGGGETGHVDPVGAIGATGAAEAVRGGAADAEDAAGASGESAEAAAVREAAPGDARDGTEEATGQRARGEGGETRSEDEPGKWGRYVGGELIAPPGTFGFKVEE